MKPRYYPLLAGFLMFLLFMPAVATVLAHSKPGTEEWCAQQIFNRNDSRIEKNLESMSLSEKVGQMLIAQIEPHHNRPQDKEYQLLSRLVQNGKVGGIMFLKGDALSAGMLKGS